MGISTPESRKAAKQHYADRNRKTKRVMEGDIAGVKKEEEAEATYRENQIKEFLKKKKHAAPVYKPKKKGTSLTKQKEALKAKYAYKEYVKSIDWGERKKQLTDAYGHACELCQKSGLIHVHHNNYKTRGHEHDEDLMILCKDCHYKFHEARHVAKGDTIAPIEKRCNVCAEAPHISISKEPRDIKLCAACLNIFFRRLWGCNYKNAIIGRPHFNVEFVI